MGEELKSRRFSAEDERVFRERAREETDLLGRHLSQAENHRGRFGFELEGCLIDAKGELVARNQDFLAQAAHPAFVPEIGSFNFEVNSRIFEREATLLSQVHHEFRTLMAHARTSGQRAGAMRPVWVGTVPSLTPRHTTLDYMTPSNRYAALAARSIELRRGKPTHIQIDRLDRIEFDHPDVMLEAAATSVQYHIEVPPRKSAAIYNLMQALAGPMVAIAANSPFLFGKKLWDETRIAAFEQAMHFKGLSEAETLDPVTLGNGWVKRTLHEVFHENLRYPVLLPMLFEAAPEKFRHLKLLNGQVWRWNRPIITPSGDAARAIDSVRIEFRPLAAGPSSLDLTANFALLLGLVLAYGPKDETENAGEWTERNFGEFSQVRQNFYDCARLGMKANVDWQGKTFNVQALLLDTLIPKARDALLSSDWSVLESDRSARVQIASQPLDAQEVRYYFDEILLPRARTGWTGAAWQKSWIDLRGPDFKAMTSHYADLQESELPVHAWKV